MHAEMNRIHHDVVTLNELADRHNRRQHALAARRNARDVESAANTVSTSSQVSSPDPSSLTKCTVPVLKEILRGRGLKVSGTKADLIERLMRGK